ncbi:MAG: S41 family peptidase [Dysgonamonadaceae bacterium]|nr:S41 family peptidase [Dysgonamonadaceae bacterium]
MKTVKCIAFTISLFLIPFFNPNSGTLAQLSEEQRFEISKQLDIFNALFNELNLYYVDSLAVEKIIQENIACMLQQLDPYTEYIPAEHIPDFQFQTTGEYGGIGSTISMRNNKIVIVEPYEGMPAALAGLIPGDEILAIDGTSMAGQTTAFASDRLKGQPDTDVKIKYRRPGENKTREITIRRKRISIPPITYYGVLEGGVGYIGLSGFTSGSALAVKEALLDLTKNKSIQSLIIDVRDNGGGVVEDCLSMLNYFLPKGELLLSMKGKVKQLDRTYRTTQSPVEPDLPLAILVNGNSASASEILSGAIQDLDRGVIVGSRTYGKGLVQAPRELPYGGRLKLTTSKYYIPSGRSIQSIDYTHRDEEGRAVLIPDTLTHVFYTARHRPVRDGGGVTPDVTVEDDKIPTLLYYMEGNSLFFDFVTQWRVKHPSIAPPAKFVLTDDIYDEFKQFVLSTDFTYDRQSEKAVESLKKIMEFEGYYDIASAEFQALADKLKPDLRRDLELYKQPISKYLAMQIMKQYYYEKGQSIYKLLEDKVLLKAIDVLRNTDLYHAILAK